MEISSEEGAMPIPINSTYGGGGHGHMHMIHHEAAPHNHIIPVPQMGSNNGPIATIPEDHVPYKKVVRYRECLKNHAATMGGNATDGCGEFMPSGSEGTLEALTCSACNCHRNFHRKEIEGDHCYNNAITSPHLDRLGGRKLILGHHHHHQHSLGYPTRGPLPAHQMIMSYNVGSVLPSESDEQEDVHAGTMPRQQMVKKRFRTKFTQEQKEKMLNFAEKVGWKIQKQEESVVQHFCQQVGVKRRVLKVWMHNNKHNLAKKDPSPSAENQI